MSLDTLLCCVDAVPMGGAALATAMDHAGVPQVDMKLPEPVKIVASKRGSRSAARPTRMQM